MGLFVYVSPATTFGLSVYNDRHTPVRTRKVSRTMHPRTSLLIVASLFTLSALACAVGGNVESAVNATLTALAPTVTAAPVDVEAQGASAVPTVTQAASPAATPDICPATNSTAMPPAESPVFANYYTVIQKFLADGGEVAALEWRLREWGAITDDKGMVATADLTGDGVAEVIVAAQAPAGQFPDVVFAPGDLWVYRCVNKSYQVFYADFSDAFRIAPTVVAVENLDTSGGSEIVYTTQVCGAHTCFVTMRALFYDAGADELADKLGETQGTTFAEGDGLPYSDIAVVDVDGDGIYELIVNVGTVGSAGAGPQRTYRNTFKWNGTEYALAESQITSPSWPIHWLQDGDRAAEAGDHAGALAIYEKLLDDATFASVPYAPTEYVEEEVLLLRRYARYRIMLMHVLLGDEASAVLAYKALVEGVDLDAAMQSGSQGEVVWTDPFAQAGFAILGDQFWTEWTANQSVEGACRLVVDYARSYPRTFEVLNQYGYQNRAYRAEDMCPYR